MIHYIMIIYRARYAKIWQESICLTVSNAGLPRNPPPKYDDLWKRYRFVGDAPGSPEELDETILRFYICLQEGASMFCYCTHYCSKKL